MAQFDTRDDDICLDEICEFALSLSDKAVELICADFASRISSSKTAEVMEKENAVDLVTKTDQAVETMIKSSIAARYPFHQFVGEETHAAGFKSRVGDGPTWIVDPIDGTTNFIHGIPSVGVSIGFTLQREPVVGVIANPFTRTVYSAIKGKGAYKNKSIRLPVLRAPFQDLSKCVWMVEWGADREGNNFEVKRQTFERLMRSQAQGGCMLRGLRSWGCASLNLCAVAEGYIDGYWEGGCWEWDVCAGWVILKEAGGLIVDGNPGVEIEEAKLDGRLYLAVRSAEKSEQERIVKEFWASICGRMAYSR